MNFKTFISYLLELWLACLMNVSCSLGFNEQFWKCGFSQKVQRFKMLTHVWWLERAYDISANHRKLSHQQNSCVSYKEREMSKLTNYPHSFRMFNKFKTNHEIAPRGVLWVRVNLIKSSLGFNERQYFFLCYSKIRSHKEFRIISRNEHHLRRCLMELKFVLNIKNFFVRWRH